MRDYEQEVYLSAGAVRLNGSALDAEEECYGIVANWELRFDGVACGEAPPYAVEFSDIKIETMNDEETYIGFPSELMIVCDIKGDPQIEVRSREYKQHDCPAKMISIVSEMVDTFASRLLRNHANIQL